MASLQKQTNTDGENNYEKPGMPRTPKEWKKWKEERKTVKRKWKEEKLIKTLEKEITREKDKEAKKLKEDDDKRTKEKKGRPYTVSIALPGSILDNAQSPELRTYLAGQIARAAVVFSVDEIIIFDETGCTQKSTEGDFDGIGKKGQANVQLARILQYLECPQYLRKSFFPQHKDLQYAGILNPLDCPHHMRTSEDCIFREGVVLDKPVKPGKGSFVNVGLQKEVQIDRELRAGVRVTVKLDTTQEDKKMRKGTVVAPSTPRTSAGLYWGYSVRLALSLGAVFSECPYKHGYDLTVGTSDKGTSVDDVAFSRFRHALIVFGGVNGLESSLEFDEALGVDDPSLLFKHYLNSCPGQGSRTIRTEEAILITLSAVRPRFHSAIKKLDTS
ncbi:putative methyltransferase C9orf114 [Gigantopelta aegis]|uniref:putative methyltransferase C9orf114 n=1 Tax=Gigantopelta aegis TaxID=1735272 RepID=UPI001B888CE2|nr:putative methyltransferase C9orf114 [Gigantopelta aegis]